MMAADGLAVRAAQPFHALGLDVIGDFGALDAAPITSGQAQAIHGNVVDAIAAEAGHGVHPGEPYRSLIIAELRGDRGEPFIEYPGPVVRSLGLGHFLPPVGHDQSDECARARYRREHQLQHADRVMQRDRRGVRQLRLV